MTCEDFRWRVHLFLDDDLGPEEQAQFAEHLEHCPDCAAYLEQVRAAGDLLRQALAVEHPQRQIASVLAKVRRAVSGERAIRVLGFRLSLPRPVRLTAMAAPVAVILCVAIYGAVLPALTGDEAVVVYAPEQFAADSTGVVKIVARDERTGAPVSGVPVRLAVYRPGWDNAITSDCGYTDAAGLVSIPVRVPDLDREDVKIEVAADLPGEPARVAEYVPVYRQTSLLLTTDKPVYQPEQRIHIRALALRMPSRKPAAGEQVTLVVSDSKGNKVFREVHTTSKYGIVSSVFQLADHVNMGSYQISAALGDVRVERTVQVRKYVLPKFNVQVNTDRDFYTPGQTLSGTVIATRFFDKSGRGEGTPVPNAHVSVSIKAVGFQAPTLSQQIIGRTDADGAFQFGQPLPDLFVGRLDKGGHGTLHIEVAVTDSANQQEHAAISRPVAGEAIDVSFVPRGGKLVRGQKSVVYVLTTYPDGKPAECSVTVFCPEVNRRWSGESGKTGIFAIQIEPSHTAVTLRATARDARGNEGRREHSLTVYYDRHLVIAAAAAVYEVGETLHADIFTGQPEGAVYVDVARDQQTVLVKSLTLRQGQASLDVDLTEDLVGTLILHAYWSGDAADALGDTAVVFVNPADDLQVAVKLDKQRYRPGEHANVEFEVKNRDGRGAASALGVRIVDPAVLQIANEDPQLQTALLALDHEALKPRWEVAESLQPASAISSLVEKPEGEWLGKRASVLANVAQPESPKVAVSDDSGSSRKERARSRAQGLLGMAFAGLAVWSLVMALVFSHALSRRLGLPQMPQAWREERRASLRRVVFWILFACASMSVAVLLIVFGFREAGTRGNHVDFWSAGLSQAEEAELEGEESSEMAGPAEESAPTPAASIEPVWSEEKVAEGSPEREQVRATAPLAPRPSPLRPELPRLRQFFPETMFVDPSVITDECGRASLEIPIADTVTSWQVSALANALDGGLGSSDAKLRVFQDFFVDIVFPVALTQGDEISVPVVLYNYLEQPQTVTLKVKRADWFDLRSAGEAKLTLQPEQVAVRYFTIVARQFGHKQMVVEARGDKLSDAVAKPVEVVPFGHPVERTWSGRLTGTAREVVHVPDDAVPNGSRALLKVYPTGFGHLVEGLDAILAFPSGCFEQTSAAAYPDVLALRYMQENGLDVPDVRAKAEQYVDLAYQRLVTFEAPGGGFSWYGEAPGEPMLTAYGLMQFADLKSVHYVDPALVTRTQEWLVQQQADDGAFEGKHWTVRGGGDARQNARFVSTAYAAWALVHSGYRGDAIGRALEYLRSGLPTTSDPYALALALNAFTEARRTDPVVSQAASRLAGLARTTMGKVVWQGGKSSFTGASGLYADVETTALAALALSGRGERPDLVDAALDFLVSKKDPRGTWGSTQATVLSLKALLAGGGGMRRGSMEIPVAVNGRTVSRLRLDAEDRDVVQQLDLTKELRPGENVIQLARQGTGVVTYQIVATHYEPWSAWRRVTGQSLAIDVSYDRRELRLQETVQERVRVRSRRDVGGSMTVVELGVPPGFVVEQEDLEALVRDDTIDRFEITDKQVIVYLAPLGPGQEKSFRYRLRAQIPVRAVAPRSVVYDYYSPDRRAESPPQRVTVALP